MTINMFLNRIKKIQNKEPATNLALIHMEDQELSLKSKPVHCQATSITLHLEWMSTYRSILILNFFFCLMDIPLNIWTTTIKWYYIDSHLKIEFGLIKNQNFRCKSAEKPSQLSPDVTEQFTKLETSQKLFVSNLN